MLLALVLVLVLFAGAAAWLLGTGSGLRFALARAQDFIPGTLQVSGAEGRLAGPLDIATLSYNDGEGTVVKLGRIHLDLRVLPLLYERLHVVETCAWIARTSHCQKRRNPRRPARSRLNRRSAVVLDQAHIGPIHVTQDGKPLFASNQLDLSARWTNAGLSIDRLALQAPDGHVNLDGKLGLGRNYRGNGHAAVDWKIADNRYVGTLDVKSNGRKAQVQLTLAEPMVALLKVELDQRNNNAWIGSLDAPTFDPKPLIGASALQQLAIKLQGSGDRRSGNVTGQLGLNNYNVLLQPLEVGFDEDFNVLTLQAMHATSPQIKGAVDASGTVRLDAKPLSANLAVNWKDLQLPPDLAGQPLNSNGSLTAKGSVDRYHAEGNVDIGPPGKLAKLQLNLDGTPQQVALHSITLKQSQGQLEAHGTLTLQPNTAWEFEASANRFDPGQLLADWPGLLDADFSTSGSLAQSGPDITLDLRKLEGTLRQRALHGKGHIHVSPNQVADGTLELASGASRVSLVAKPGVSNDADVTLAIASLNDWLPDTGGSINGQFRVRGKLPKLAVAGTLQGQSVAWQEQKIGQLQLTADVPDISAPGGKLTIDADTVEAGGLAFQRVRIDGHGTSAQHQLTLDAQGQQLSTALTLNGALKGSNWNGSLSALTLDVQGLPRWHQQQATRMAYTDGAFTLGELCLTAGDPLLCLSGHRDKGGNIDAAYRLHDVPLALVMTAAAPANMPVRADGTLEGSGKIQRSAAGALKGNASITSSQGSVTYLEHPDHPVVTYRNLALNATLAPASQHITLRAALNGDGNLDGQIAITGARQVLDGQLALKLDSLGFVELFTERIASVKGRADGTFRIGGTLQEPTLTGQARVIDFAAEVPDAGIKLTQGQLTLSAADTRSLRINGTVQSGKGKLTIEGVAGVDPQAPTAITIKGNQFTAADTPAVKVTISPDVLVRRDAQGINASGSVKLDNADVNVDKLPGGDANKASADIVIVDQPQPTSGDASLPITASIKVDLGSRTHLVGMGLDGKLSGVLTVNERPGRETTGQGQISVTGTYKAYGQNLPIQQGQLLFASTPIDNPGLNIRAVRSLTPTATVDEGQQVGLQISGTAQRPVLTVFSNPVMEQSDALSYLVTGKPLSQVKGGESSMVSTAAQALGSATGNLLAKSVGSKLGLDDIGVSSNDALNGNSAFTVGKYLSPRLYLSYGVGLFEPGQVITLRYRLTRRWSFEAQNATDFNRASFNYRYER